MRFNEFKSATERRSDKATKGKTGENLPRLSLRRFVGSSLHRSPHAFTLVEVMIVVVIIGLLAGVVVYSTAGYMDRAKRQKARADISTLSGAVDSYYLANSRHPTNQEGLQVLVPGFIKLLPKDPWGNPYAYVQPGINGPGSFDIISYGADGRLGGTGADADITSNDVETKEAVKK
jgi:general secretion pathway protein G